MYADRIHRVLVAFGWQRGRTTYFFIGEMDSRDPSELLAKHCWFSQILRDLLNLLNFWRNLAGSCATLLNFWLSQVLRERSGGAALRQGFIKAVRTTVFPVQCDVKEDFSDEAKYLTFFQGVLEFELFPHARCP